jgi:hypothetical protein
VPLAGKNHPMDFGGKNFPTKMAGKTIMTGKKGSVVLPEVLESDLHGQDGGSEVSQVVDQSLQEGRHRAWLREAGIESLNQRAQTADQQKGLTKMLNFV